MQRPISGRFPLTSFRLPIVFLRTTFLFCCLLFAWLPASFLAWLFAWLLACLLACLVAVLLGLLGCWVVGLLAWLAGLLVGTVCAQRQNSLWQQKTTPMSARQKIWLNAANTRVAQQKIPDNKNSETKRHTPGTNTNLQNNKKLRSKKHLQLCKGQHISRVF